MNKFLAHLVLFLFLLKPVEQSPVKLLMGDTLTEKPQLTVAFNPNCDIIPQKAKYLTFRATAYSLKGRTASGEWVRHGIIAVDRSIIKLGRLVRIISPKSVAGVYIARDTGGLIKGKKIDIFMASKQNAINFGIQTVKLELL